ncbi:MAG: cyclic 2,3-diphosphoglycerate synthase [Candidatus Thermoplasmatota archaeon]
MSRQKVVILGAAGRDFHNFNVCFRGRPEHEVVAFTATQIPHIKGRIYPKELAGEALYPKGIPIRGEGDLEEIIRKNDVDVAVFSYSDVSYTHLMNVGARVNASGADFVLLSPERTMLKAKVPVIAVCAVRTGSGKSQTTRKVCKILKDKGRRVVAIRHPMPYGDLTKQVVQRFATYEDMEMHHCTIEEREEYEPHIDSGIIVYAGVDYGAILEQAEREADVIVWDGGNNDTPFYVPDLHITIVDPHRPGHEMSYYPGETNLRMADVVIINKVSTADPQNLEIVRRNVARANPRAAVIMADSPIFVEDPEMIRGKKVLVVEDGPTLTHGEMRYGAGTLAAKDFGAAEIVNPRPYAVGEIAETFQRYPEIGNLLPAMGYGKKQIDDLRQTINSTPCDVVISGTPINLSRAVRVNKPVVRVKYELRERDKPDLEEVLQKF